MLRILIAAAALTAMNAQPPKNFVRNNSDRDTGLLRSRSMAPASNVCGMIGAALTVGLLGKFDPRYVFLVGIIPALFTVWIRRAVPVWRRALDRGRWITMRIGRRAGSKNSTKQNAEIAEIAA